MNDLLFLRLMRMRKEWKSVVFWIFFPIVMTLFFYKIVGLWEEETKIPIGLVVEEKTELSTKLVERIQQADYLEIAFLDRADALNKLEKHELDSVFVIRKKYEEHILHNRRNQLIEAYSSNQSYAYFAVVEFISSLAQEDASRSKAAFEIKEIYQKYETDESWEWKEIVQKSEEKQMSKDLIQTNFSYQQHQQIEQNENLPIVNIWGVWAFFSILTTLFIFEWVLRENQKNIRIRWMYTKFSFKKYAVFNLLIYTAIFLLVDLVSILIIQMTVQKHISIALFSSVLFFRIVMNIFAFLFTYFYKHSFYYYLGSFIMTLLFSILGGALFPIDGLTKEWGWVSSISPVYALLNEQISVFWLILMVGAFCFWLWRGDKIRA